MDLGSQELVFSNFFRAGLLAFNSVAFLGLWEPNVLFYWTRFWRLQANFTCFAFFGAK